MIRVVSLVPSLSELLVALGLGPALVGRTGFCIHPSDVMRGIPKVGGTKDVQMDRLRALAPTHVIVNVDENRRETVDDLRQFVPHVVVTHPNAPADNLSLLSQLVAVFSDELDPSARQQLRQRADALAADLTEALDEVRRQAWVPRRTVYLIWRQPWMTVARDTYIARMLAEVGWMTWPPVQGGAHGAARYPVLAGNEPWLVDVEELLLSSEPYRFGMAHVAEAQALCPQARVRLVDGELISWYGPRAAAGLRYLRQLAETPA